MEAASPNRDAVKTAITQTMAFFSLYELPLNLHTIHQLLYKQRGSFADVSIAVGELVASGKLVAHDGLYALKAWDDGRVLANKKEIQKRWRKVDKYFWALSIIPFIDHVSIINSLAFGNAHQESDIDFFVVTKPHRLYTVRSLIIVIFRLLGVYKTRQHINERFCFGFYVTSNKPELEPVLIPGEDPLFAFWFASFAPLINIAGYRHLVVANPWVYGYFPNFDLEARLSYIKEKNRFLRLLKGLLEILLTIPAILFEPFLRSIHIRHTFNLPENSWATSTTIANQDMLKLHALDPRIDVRGRFRTILREL
ncbi:MAG: hypothetical protein KW788_05235 [Candidatus Doudnabacteria bacterium]|nr:hypothetical protein [Candidatus Doudnabacteria bacterium]